MRSSVCDSRWSLASSAITLFFGFLMMMMLVPTTNSFMAAHVPLKKKCHPSLLSLNYFGLRVQRRPLFLSSQPSSSTGPTALVNNLTQFDRQIASFLEQHAEEESESTPPPVDESASSSSPSWSDTVAISPAPLSEPPPERKALEPIVYHVNKALIDMVYNIICTLYPIGDGSASSKKKKEISSKAFVRFYVLETVARVPYFAYLSVLHLRETFGERAFSNAQENRLRTHYAEADNELHHLLIMESLGGNRNPFDRLVAQSMAFVYYWYVVLVYSLVSSQAAYHLSELIEDHAYETYDEFLQLYGAELKTLPVPEIAKQYYLYDYPSFFPLFCTTGDAHRSAPGCPATPPPHIQLHSLYDVFVCVRNDEKEHWKTLCNLVQYDHMSADRHFFPAPIESTKPATTTQ